MLSFLWHKFQNSNPLIQPRTLLKQSWGKNRLPGLYGETLKRSEALQNITQWSDKGTLLLTCVKDGLTDILCPQTVLPSKAIKNERILETLMFQANSGMYRIHDSYLRACQEGLRHQDSKLSESFDCTLWLVEHYYFVFMLWKCDQSRF